MNKKEFVRGYIQAALWTSICENDEDCEHLDEKYDESDLAKETLAQMEKDCDQFIKENENDLFDYKEQRGIPFDADYTESDCAGHDFWLTRNGHGAGFWDRGLGELGDKLTSATEKYSEAHLYVGDDGKIYQHN